MDKETAYQWQAFYDKVPVKPLNAVEQVAIEVAFDLSRDPDFAALQREIGPDQMRANAMAGLRRMHERAKAEGRPSGAAMAAARFGIDLDESPPPSAPPSR